MVVEHRYVVDSVVGVDARLGRQFPEKDVQMAEFVIKMADERGRVLEQVERGYSPAEVQERFAQQATWSIRSSPKGC